MIPVVTIITLIEVVTALVSVSGKTIEAVDKLRNGNPDDVDIDALRDALMELPDLTKLFPPKEDDKNIDE